MSERGVWLRLVAAFGALALGIAAAVIVAVLAHRTPGPVGAATTPAPTPTAPTGTTAFPAPPPNAVVFSRPYGSDVLALAVVPGRELGLQASVLGQQGEGVDGLNVSFRVGSQTADGQSCGAGCYRADVASAGSPKLVEVAVERDRGKTTWRVPMPRQWPPPDASAIIQRATRTFRALRSVAVRDWLASGPGRPLFTRWMLVAPDRLTYQVEHGSAAVIIGDRRWDKIPGGKWEESEQTPIHQPTPFWRSWTDAHVLESSKSAWRVSFFEPQTPGWYELTIAKRTMNLLELRMHATAHFMREVYGHFNAPVKVTPPSSRPIQ
jgi:hypothetical protein